MRAPEGDSNADSCVPIPLLPHPDVTKWNRFRRHRRETTPKKKREDPCECCRMGRSGYTCVRHTLCCVNLLFWMIGCGMLGIGVWMHLAYGGYSTLMPTYRSLSADSLCIAAGIITFLIGFFGCCGSWFQSKCLLRMYFGLVIVVFILEFTVGIAGFAFRRQVGETIREELKAAIQDRYSTSDDVGLAEVWDQLQTDFECCGVTSYHDWYNVAAWPKKEWVPRSCCIQRFRNITSCGEKGEVYRWHQSGCYQRLHNWLMERLYIVGIISVIFAFIQLFGLISAMLIICILIDREKYR